MSKKKFFNYTIYVLFSIYLIFVLLGIKEFKVWNQILSVIGQPNLQDFLTTITKIVLEKHTHIFRLILLSPILFLAYILNIKTNYLFSIIIVILIFIMIKILNDLSQKLTEKKTPSLALTGIMIIISFFLNGRGILAMFGITLILNAYYHNILHLFSVKKFIFHILLGCFFCTVSSGTFFVALGSILLFFVCKIIKDFPKIHKSYLKLFLIFFIFFILLTSEIIKFIQKNLLFYEGSIIKLMKHGIGNVIPLSIILLSIGLIIAISPLLFLIIKKLLKKHLLFQITLPIILSSLCIGIFGFLSLFICFPAILIIIEFHINSKKYILN
tara:strand:- start:5332 stop:6312 length:981 start_codon:yes stop_codon:yes gene_type:complete